MKVTETAIIVPAYNEGKVIRKVLEDVLEVFNTVLCVDDGSKDETKKEAERTKAIVLSHILNIGQGGALQTGINYALSLDNINYFVTFDSDGQHQTEDAVKMLELLKKERLDIVIGSRFIENSSNVPLLKKLMLKAATLFTRYQTGLSISDTHNGLRVFNKKFAEKINLVNYDMAHASEILELIKKDCFKYREYPVTIKYTEYSKSKGQPILNSINILFDLLLNRKK